MNILCVFAHPDDEVLGAGGTIARYAEEGHRVDVRFVTRARQYDNSSEMLDAIKALMGDNASFGYGLFADQQLDTTPLLSIIEWIESAPTPDLLVTHYLHDLNLDHQLTARAALTAFRDCPKVLMCRPIPHALPGHPFEPNYWVRLHADHAAAAQRALVCYKSEAREWPHWRCPSAFSSRWYELPNTYAAEPFQVVRWIDELANPVLPSDRK